MNKHIKYLIEDIQKFNPVDYEDEDIIGISTIDNTLYKYHPKTWKELKEAAAEYVKLHPPGSGRKKQAKRTLESAKKVQFPCELRDFSHYSAFF